MAGRLLIPLIATASVIADGIAVRSSRHWAEQEALLLPACSWECRMGPAESLRPQNVGVTEPTKGQRLTPKLKTKCREQG